MSKIAIVTGGTRGIGEAISKGLKEAGYKVAATYAGNDAAAREVQEGERASRSTNGMWAIPRLAPKASPRSRPSSARSMCSSTMPASRSDDMFHRMTPEQWSAVIRTNLDSLFNMTRPVIEGMRARGFGRIISISSINGQKGPDGPGELFDRQGGRDRLHQGSGAGECEQGHHRERRSRPAISRPRWCKPCRAEVLKTKILPQIPVGRLGEADEIAAAVIYLAGDKGGFITGSTLSVNGGQYMA